MSYLWALLVSALRIIFLRGSPERIYYTRRLFIVVLMLALCASATAQALYFGDHLVFVILRVFAEVTMFMLMIVFLTAKIARFRLARMMLALVLISLLADCLLVAASPLRMLDVLQPEVVNYFAYAVGAIAVYGAGSCLAWGLQKPLVTGVGGIALYVAAAVGLDLAFRGLYEIMAAG